MDIVCDTGFGAPCLVIYMKGRFSFQSGKRLPLGISLEAFWSQIIMMALEEPGGSEWRSQKSHRGQGAWVRSQWGAERRRKAYMRNHHRLRCYSRCTVDENEDWKVEVDCPGKQLTENFYLVSKCLEPYLGKSTEISAPKLSSKRLSRGGGWWGEVVIWS